LSQFQCGEAELDGWLKRRALQNQERGASRTYVVCSGSHVVGYYALAAGAATHALAPGRVRRNMPDPVPVMVIGRLAIDLRFQGHGLGSALLRDAILRTMQAAEIAGIRAILVHALSDSAKRFYLKSGFMSSPADPMTLMIAVAEAAHALRQKP
jgi:GNAT superfamily N-acetyltransferase